jgi:diphthamide biosynthesis protein 3
MGAAWDEVDLLDMAFEAARDVYTYPCPCGDLFMMPVDDLLCAEELAPCPSCSLLLRVKYDPDAFLRSVQVVEEAASAGAEAPAGGRTAAGAPASAQGARAPAAPREGLPHGEGDSEDESVPAATQMDGGGGARPASPS